MHSVLPVGLPVLELPDAGGAAPEEAAAGGVKDPVAGYIPVRRRAKPEDIIPLVLFLASPASSYLSGNLYLADGGLMARG